MINSRITVLLAVHLRKKCRCFRQVRVTVLPMLGQEEGIDLNQVLHQLSFHQK